VRLSPEQRSALQTIGNAALGVGLGLSVLAVAFVVSQLVTGQGSAANATSSPASPRVTAGVVSLATATRAPTPPSTLPASPTPAPTSVPTTPAPTPASTPAPSATPDPLTVTAYSNSGKRYAALRAPVGYVYVAPVAGTVQVRLYQLIDGEVRVGSSVPSLPFFPYITLESADRRIIFRPGALDADTELIVKDGDRVGAGAPLFKTIGEGASSWRTFYDRGVTANVIASVAALPTGAELDPVAFFSAR
jgi:hypothetical protein